MARIAPGATSVRPFLHRLRGVKIEGKVFIGEDVLIESEYPECVEIHEGCTINLRSTLVAHVRGRGKIVLEKDVFLGATCLVIAAPGKEIRIGEGTVVAAGSIVSNSLPARTFCWGHKAEPLANATVPLSIGASYGAFMSGLRPIPKSAGKGSGGGSSPS